MSAKLEFHSNILANNANGEQCKVTMAKKKKKEGIVES